MSKVIEQLNIILGNELVAINQYFLHYKIYQDQGFEKLAIISKKESIDEMKHADSIISRILFLKGIPNMNNYKKIKIGKDVADILKSDLDTECSAINDLKIAIKVCFQENDIGSKDLLEKILISEEVHQEFLETQIDLIQKVGFENYLSTQIS